jgi:small subunit ribosomal protein S10
MAETKTKKTPARKSSAKAKAADAGASKLRLRVRGYDHKVLDQSVKQIVDTALRFDADVVGPIPLPTDIRKFTVNASTFVYKDAREQFEMRTHKRIIDIMNPTPKIIDALTNLSLPSGVSVDVKMN